MRVGFTSLFAGRSGSNRRSTAARSVAVMMLLALGASACAGPADPTAAADTAAADTAATDSEATNGQTDQLVGEFTTMSGETLDLASLQGEDAVLWFWAPW